MKRLIVCCDGTWNDADSPAETTNVVRIARAIQPQDIRAPGIRIDQIVYYHAGVGTGGDQVEKLLGGAIGLGLGRDVREAYTFLSHNYCDGDEVFFFGFSRGAYTARSVAGLINWAGLLYREDMDDFELLWDTYRQRDRTDPVRDQAQREAFLSTHFPVRHAPVPITCIGVWDTVGALGIPGHVIDPRLAEYYNFYDTNLGGNVSNAFQALALDERREDFTPTLWQLPPNAPTGQTLLQVWFPGVHSDIGGGYDKHGLSDVALAWMAGQVAPLLELDPNYLTTRQDHRRPWALGELHESATGLWTLLGRIDRHPTPGQPATREFIHRSFVTRAGSPDSEPPNYKSRAIGAPVPEDCLAALGGLEASLRWQATDPGQTGDTPRPDQSLLGRLIASLGGG